MAHARRRVSAAAAARRARLAARLTVLRLALATAAVVVMGAMAVSGSGGAAVTRAGESQATAAALLDALNLTRSPIAALFVFGDSLVDVGNNNYGTYRFLRADLPPYGINYREASGRFSDGRLQTDFLARYLGLPSPPPVLQPGRSASRGLNFASAGAGVLDSTNPGQAFPLSFQLGKFREVHAAVVGQASGEQGSGSNESAATIPNGGDAGSVGSSSSGSSSSSSEESLPDKNAIAAALYVVQVGSNDYLYLLSHLNMGLVPNIPTSLPPRNATRPPRFRNATNLPRVPNTTALPPLPFNSTALPSASSAASVASAASASMVPLASSPERTAGAENASDSTRPATRLRRVATRGGLPLEEAVSRPPQSVTDRHGCAALPGVPAAAHHVRAHTHAGAGPAHVLRLTAHRRAPRPQRAARRWAERTAGAPAGHRHSHGRRWGVCGPRCRAAGGAGLHQWSRGMLRGPCTAERVGAVWAHGAGERHPHALHVVPLPLPACLLGCLPPLPAPQPPACRPRVAWR
ncbi:unnamed protein product [Closterium sp. NIES-53]